MKGGFKGREGKKKEKKKSFMFIDHVSHAVDPWQTELPGQMAVKDGAVNIMRPTEAALMEGTVWWPLVWANCSSSLRC